MRPRGAPTPPYTWVAAVRESRSIDPPGGTLRTVHERDREGAELSRLRASFDAVRQQYTLRGQDSERAREALAGVDPSRGQLISRALVVYTGPGYPGGDTETRKAAVIAAFGRKVGRGLADDAEAVLAEMDGLKPDLARVTHNEAGEWASTAMVDRHPWIDREARNCLRLAYDWWYH